MTEERIKTLEDRVLGLLIANEGLAASVAHLTTTVTALTETVQTLRDTMNQGRGAIWLGMTAAGGMGAMLVVFAKKVAGIF